MTVYFPFLADSAEILRYHAGKDGLMSADTTLEFRNGNFKSGRFLFAVDVFAFGERNPAYDDGGSANAFAQAVGIMDFGL